MSLSRSFLRRSGLPVLPALACAFAVAFATLATASARPALDRPNVIVVLLDDAGYGDFSHTGNPTIRTPHLSRLVSEGAHFPQFYSASPACSASRYGLLTGRNPRRSGFGTWVLGPDHARYLHPREITLAEGLKDRGYATALFGKWHLGTPNAANRRTPEALPLAHGFDRWLGTNVSHDYKPGSQLLRGPAEAGEPAAGYEILAPDVGADPTLQAGLTARYADAAIAFIREKKDQPFFIELAPNMPHLPVQASAAFQGRSPRGPYGDCLEEIDHHLGRLRAAVEEAGLAANTLIVFTSDNGPWIRFQNTTGHPDYGDARFLVGSALPFRDGKGSTWEGGLRVPGVWWWPGTIAPGTLVSEPASTLDLLPTVFALAGATLPSDRPLDGRDLRPYLHPSLSATPVPPFRFAFTGNPDNALYAFRAGPWKLHTRIASQTGNDYGFHASPAAPLLFQLEQDPSERIDQAASHPAELAALKAALEAFEASCIAAGTFWDKP